MEAIDEILDLYCSINPPLSPSVKATSDQLCSESYLDVLAAKTAADSATRSGTVLSKSAEEARLAIVDLRRAIEIFGSEDVRERTGWVAEREAENEREQREAEDERRARRTARRAARTEAAQVAKREADAKAAAWRAREDAFYERRSVRPTGSTRVLTTLRSARSDAGERASQRVGARICAARNAATRSRSPMAKATRTPTRRTRAETRKPRIDMTDSIDP